MACRQVSHDVVIGDVAMLSLSFPVLPLMSGIVDLGGKTSISEHAVNV